MKPNNFSKEFHRDFYGSPEDEETRARFWTPPTEEQARVRLQLLKQIPIKHHYQTQPRTPIECDYRTVECHICETTRGLCKKRICWRHRKFDFWNKRACEGCFKEHSLGLKSTKGRVIS